MGLGKSAAGKDEEALRPRLPASLEHLWDLSAEEKWPETNELHDNWSAIDTTDLYEKFELDFSESTELTTSQTAPMSEVNSFTELESMKELTENREMNPEDSCTSQEKATSSKGYCNCQKSKCLKLYCECFASQQCCIDCGCAGCHNLPKYSEEKKVAAARAKARNPLGFFRRLSAISQKPSAGCNCSKSRCQRNYCSCYKAGIKCTEACKCNQCRNCESTLGSSEK